MIFNTQQFIDDVLSLVPREIKWEHQGRDPETGMDCIGLPRYAFSRQGKLPDELEAEFAAYHRKPDGERMCRIMRRWFQEIATNDQQELVNIPLARPGNLIVMYWKRNPCHIGVLVNPTEVVEAFKKADFAKIRKGEPRLPIATVFRIPETLNG